MGATLNTCGARLEHLRAMVPGLSWSELDRLAGLARGHSALIFAAASGDGRGKREPRQPTVEKLAGVFGVPKAWLALHEGEVPVVADVQAAVVRARARAGRKAARGVHGNDGSQRREHGKGFRAETTGSGLP